MNREFTRPERARAPPRAFRGPSRRIFVNIRPTTRAYTPFLSILLSCTFGVAACNDAEGPSGGLAGPSDIVEVETAVDAAAAGAETQDADVAIAWFRLSFDLTRDEGLFPPPAARAYAYASVTLWEAIAPGVAGGTSLAGRLNGLADVPVTRDALHWPTVANAALAETMRRFYTGPSSMRAIRELEQRFARRYRSEIPGALFGRSVAHGQRVATAIRQWSRGDGYDVYHDCTYTPPSGPDLWSPTPPGFEAPVEPCWGELRPFVLSGPEACAAGPHPPYSEDPASEFFQQAFEVYETVNDLTEEQRTIALFWADLAGESGTPAGHSLSIAAQALEQDNASLDLAAETFARVGIGESDAFISSWATKYHYNLLRPIIYINDRIDPDWQSALETPPFPAYTSGHSNDVGAASTILTALFGDGFAITDHTNDDRGFAPRSFGSFFEAADESAISRLYGGIHYRFDIEQGLEQGRCVGRVVNDLAFRTAAHARR
jgi:hypothetical protein